MLRLLFPLESLWVESAFASLRSFNRSTRQARNTRGLRRKSILAPSVTPRPVESSASCVPDAEQSLESIQDDNANYQAIVQLAELMHNRSCHFWMIVMGGATLPVVGVTNRWPSGDTSNRKSRVVPNCERLERPRRLPASAGV